MRSYCYFELDRAVTKSRCASSDSSLSISEYGGSMDRIWIVTSVRSTLLHHRTSDHWFIFMLQIAIIWSPFLYQGGVIVLTQREDSLVTVSTTPLSERIRMAKLMNDWARYAVLLSTRNLSPRNTVGSQFWREGLLLKDGIWFFRFNSIENFFYSL